MKYNIIFDGNFFIFRSLYSLNKKNGKLLSTDNDKNEFIQKIATDFSFQIKKFENVLDNVIWTLDSKSWRKDFYPESEYKSHRKNNENIDWDGFNFCVDEFSKIIESKGVNVSKIDGSEGDDLIYAWSTHFLSNGKNSLIISGDKDLIQLVKANSLNLSVFYSPIKNEVIIPDTFRTRINVFPNVSNKHKIKKSIINSDIFIFEKIIKGDRSDNINSVYTSPSGRGLGDKGAEKVIDSFLKKNNGEISFLYLNSNEYISLLADCVIENTKANHSDKNNIINSITLNRNLMLLSTFTLPPPILKSIYESINESIFNGGILNIDNLSKKENLLKNTKFKFQEDLYEDDEDPNDFSFITN